MALDPIVDERKPAQTRQDHLYRDPAFEPCQRRPDAEMVAEAEAQVRRGRSIEPAPRRAA